MSGFSISAIGIYWITCTSYF